MGLSALPLEQVPEGGFELVECLCAEPDLRIWIERRFLSPPYVRDGCLIFTIEGFGRFRLWLTGE
ncbi:MAG: hypothetical protein RBU45_21135 [Myxococcota bacterium]|nr:hypothetical protein [Myxococcota bacterium]